FPPWTVLSGGCWPALRFWDSGNIKKNEEFMAWVVPLRTFPRVETIGEIEKKELASIGDLHTYLSKLTDKDPGKLSYYTYDLSGGWVWTQLGSCSDYGLYTDFEKMAGIQKKEGVDCRSSHLHIQGQ
ncbi:hypothetical protein HID58_082936, partial [Brassica napus]